MALNCCHNLECSSAKLTVAATSSCHHRQGSVTYLTRRAFPTQRLSKLRWNVAQSSSHEVGANRCRGRVVNRKIAVRADGHRDADGTVAEAVPGFDISRLEAYTQRVPSEVLCVNAVVDDEEDQVIVFKGFSSSLTRPTPEDLAEQVLPSTAVVLSIDRIRGPYNPSKTKYIQQGISWQDFRQFLELQGL